MLYYLTYLLLLLFIYSLSLCQCFISSVSFCILCHFCNIWIPSFILWGFQPPSSIDLTHHPLLSYILLSLYSFSTCPLGFCTPLYFHASLSLFYPFPLLVLTYIFISELFCLHPIPILPCILPHLPSYPSCSHPPLVPSLHTRKCLVTNFISVHDK